MKVIFHFLNYFTDGLHSEWSQVNDKFIFSHQCSEWFIIQGVTVVFNNPSKIVLADWIWHSYSPPIWDAPGGLFCHTIQSAPFSSCKKLSILSCFISVNSHCNSFRAPTKFVPLFDQIEWTVPLLAINVWSAKMKESASKELVVSICTVLPEKQVKKAS